MQKISIVQQCWSEIMRFLRTKLVKFIHSPDLFINANGRFRSNSVAFKRTLVRLTWRFDWLMEYFRMKMQNKPSKPENFSLWMVVCCGVYFDCSFYFDGLFLINFYEFIKNFFVKEAVKDKSEQERRIYKE